MRACAVHLFFVAITLFASPFASAQKKEGDGKKEPSDPILARSKSAFDTLWIVPAKGTPKILELFGEVRGGTRVLTPPGQRGALDVKEGDLRVTLVGGLPELSPSPVLETIIELQPAKDHDVDLKLDRGIVLIEAGKDSPGGKALVRIQDRAVSITLHKGSVVALELYSRWPVGVRLPKNAKPGVEPVTELWLFLLRGKADVVLEAEKQLLTAPILYHWDSFGGVQGPAALKKIPEWVDPAGIMNKEALGLLNAGEKIRRRSEKDAKAWSDALESKEEKERIIAVYRAIGMDGVGSVIKVLNGDKSAEVRKAAAYALRSFAGRGTDQVQQLYTALADQKIKAGQAGILTHLLQGFSPEERNRPELYDSLIEYLGHDLMGIRHLAADQLAQLVPAGKDIAFDAAAGADARARAQEAWRKLIPSGSLPKIEKK